MKTLTITNGKEFIDIECDKLINLRVSEECVTQFTYKDKVNPEEIVLSVLLERAKVDPKEWSNWSLIK